MHPLRRFALARLGLDRDAAEGVMAGLLVNLRQTAAALAGLPLCRRDLRTEDAIAPCRAESASAFASVFRRVVRESVACSGMHRPNRGMGGPKTGMHRPTRGMGGPVDSPGMHRPNTLVNVLA